MFDSIRVRLKYEISYLVAFLLAELKEITFRIVSFCTIRESISATFLLVITGNSLILLFTTSVGVLRKKLWIYRRVDCSSGQDI